MFAVKRSANFMLRLWLFNKKLFWETEIVTFILDKSRENILQTAPIQVCVI